MASTTSSAAAASADLPTVVTAAAASSTSSNGASKPATPLRPRHQVTRSISELSSPIRLHRHNGRDRDRDSSRSAFPPPAPAPPRDGGNVFGNDGPAGSRPADPRDEQRPSQSAGHVLGGGGHAARRSLDIVSGASAAAAGGLRGYESAAYTPNISPFPSRRASLLAASAEDEAAILAAMAGAAPPQQQQQQQQQQPAGDSGAPVQDPLTTLPGMPPGLPKGRQLQIAKERISAATQGLKTTMADLTTLSTATTRRLDESYYSVLEKLSALQSTVLAIKELAVAAQQSTADFGRESAAIERDVSLTLAQATLESDAQQARITDLQSRVAEGKSQLATLSRRVDGVRTRVEAWERADAEWQERTRRRLTVVWVLTSAVAFLVLLLVVAAKYAPDGTAQQLQDGVVAVIEDGVQSAVGGVGGLLGSAVSMAGGAGEDAAVEGSDGEVGPGEVERRAREARIAEAAAEAVADLDRARDEMKQLIWSPQSLAVVDGGAHAEQHLQNWSTQGSGADGGDDSRLRLFDEL